MNNIIEFGKEVIRLEVEAINNLSEQLDSNFEGVVKLIAKSKGRVIISGVGKSGIIARKIVATLNSTGTPSFFLHPSDAIHGDLGMVRKEDIVVFISKSGATQELVRILPLIKRLKAKIVSMVGNKNSMLADESDFVLDVSVREEACPYDLAPTSSTTATLVMGDALAIALLKVKNFSKEEFAFYHPGGELGKRLTLKVDEIMASYDKVPIVNINTQFRQVIIEMTTKRLGATCVVDNSGTLIGIITDGDLRRLLERENIISELKAKDIMGINPKTVLRTTLASSAIQLMENYKITQLIVVDDNKKPVGMIHLHDLVNLGFLQR